MNNSVITGVIIIILAIVAFLFFNKKSASQDTPNSKVQGMNTNMPGMDHGSMNTNQ